MSVKFKPRFFLPEEQIEPQALQQVYNISKLDVLAGPIAIMPDCHYGKGAVVGSVVPTKSAILPAALGVDLSCGMVAAKLNITASDLPESLAAVRYAIEDRVPTGFSMHSGSGRSKETRALINRLAREFKTLSIATKIPTTSVDKIEGQLGSLGSGNHFVEVCVDTDNSVWLMLHSFLIFKCLIYNSSNYMRFLIKRKGPEGPSPLKPSLLSGFLSLEGPEGGLFPPIGSIILAFIAAPWYLFSFDSKAP